MNEDLARTYDRIAQDWHRDPEHDDWWVAGTEKFLSYLSPGATVLDVGCGSGMKSKFMSERGFKVTGIDISARLLEIARTEAPACEFIQKGMEDLPLLGRKFFSTFAQASLLHIHRADAAAVIGKMAESVEPGGYVYIAVKEVREGQPLEQVVKEEDYGYEYERFFSYYRMPQLEPFFPRAGLSVAGPDVLPPTKGRTTWLQIIGKK